VRTSDSTERAVDEEVRRIVLTAHDDAIALLRDNRERLDRLAHALLAHETLEGEAAYRAAGLEPPIRPRPAALQLAA
jgi:cell division protease FtsH